MNARRMLALPLILIFCFVMIPFSSHALTVTDMAGRKVSAPFDPQRIICLGPGALRLIVYLEAQEKVVGIEDLEKKNPGGRPYWMAHSKLMHLPSCGPGGPAGINKKPDMEAVLSVKPQVIFITYMESELAGDVQKTLGIPVVVLSYGEFASFDERVYDALRIAGKILNREKRADDVVSYIESMRGDLMKRTVAIPEENKHTAYVGGVGYRGGHGIESTKQDFFPFEWVNAKNAAKDVPSQFKDHLFIDKEMLYKLNPDIIFIDGGGIELVQDDYKKKPKFYNALRAFREGSVYVLHPYNWYTTNIGTAAADAYAIGKILYPESFADIDSSAKSDEIYTFLVGKPVVNEMNKSYGINGRPLFSD